ncbi:MAG: M42 family metallopeptidase [Coriobacteriales bacterium]|nr:M42 family metallopeptidase [Coriobacteriales bacterium]
MIDKDIQFLSKLIDAPSPSGYEAPAAQIVRERMEQTADEVKTDAMGSVHATLKGNGNGPSILLTGHIDEIGLQVKYIDDKGFVYFDAIGGIDTTVLPGQRVKVYCKDGAYDAVISSKSVHLMDPEERKKLVEVNKLFVDMGMDAEEAKRHVRIGDPIVIDAGLTRFGNGMITSRALDDKAGIFICIKVMEEVKAAGGIGGDLTVVGTVQEEIGLRGAMTATFGVDPDVGIAVDTGTATDHPGVDVTKKGLFKLGEGPLVSRGPNINPVLFEMMIAAAEKAGAKYQIMAAPRGTGTDANNIQLSRSGKVTGLVSVPLRYLHTPCETAAESDIDDAVKILTQVILDIDESTDFTPRVDI